MAQRVVRPRVRRLRAWFVPRSVAPGRPFRGWEPRALHAFCHLWTEAWALSRACAVLGIPEEAR